MQIKSLRISKYKNLENLKFKFESDLITLLVGQNGLGKSNLLEAIAIIFSALDLAENEEEFTTDPHKDFFDFQVWYLCKGCEIKIVAENESLKIEIKDAEDTAFSQITFTQFKKDRAKYLPDYIIGYYSGENSRIKEYFKRHSSNRLNSLKRNSQVQALGKMFFTEENCGELLFFTLWVYKNAPGYRDKIIQLLSHFVRIEESSEVVISFKNPDFSKNFPEQNADDLLVNIQNGRQNPFWGLTGRIDALLRLLYNNNSAHSVPRSFEDETFDPSYGTGFVFFENLDYTTLYEELEETFGDPIHLFDALHAAHQLGIVYKMEAVISKDGVKETHNFRELSEGEQQLLTVLGLILITGRDDCLFLLDEPDTHLNPKWQREYVSLLHTFNINSSNSHILVCTHSPLIVQASEKADIFLFKKGEQGIVEATFNDFKIENWRIDQVLASEYFEFDNTRAPQLDDYMKLREELLSKPELTTEDIKRLADIEKEQGILPSGETLNDFRAMHLIRTMAKDLESND